MAETYAFASGIANLVFSQTSWTPPTGWWVALGSNSLIYSGNERLFNELAGSGYARQPVTWTTSTNGDVSNTAEILFPKVTGALEPVSYVALCTSVSGSGIVLSQALDQAYGMPVGSQFRLKAGYLSVRWP